mmetsp:Transcript_120919/g.349366  ORF Transcript_120919/g.349366 Transcript_120919/m.349366 type:complete len:214 (+) Transcript_120919:37-678(+)
MCQSLGACMEALTLPAPNGRAYASESSEGAAVKRTPRSRCACCTSLRSPPRSRRPRRRATCPSRPASASSVSSASSSPAPSGCPGSPSRTPAGRQNRRHRRCYRPGDSLPAPCCPRLPLAEWQTIARALWMRTRCPMLSPMHLAATRNATRLPRRSPSTPSSPPSSRRGRPRAASGAATRLRPPRTNEHHRGRDRRCERAHPAQHYHSRTCPR